MHVMATNNVSLEALFSEGAIILDDSPMHETPPEADKTLTTCIYACTGSGSGSCSIDGGNEEVRYGSTPSQGMSSLLMHD